MTEVDFDSNRCPVCELNHINLGLQDFTGCPKDKGVKNQNE